MSSSMQDEPRWVLPVGKSPFDSGCLAPDVEGRPKRGLATQGEAGLGGRCAADEKLWSAPRRRTFGFPSSTHRHDWCESVAMAALPRPTAAETNLYSEGAEFLVLGQLLIRGIHATKAYTRFPGWDLLATNPETGQTCRVQVKSRLATDYNGGFPIKNFDAEFVVHVALNRSYRYSRARRTERDPADTGERPPEFFVLPMAVVVKACEAAGTWGTSSKVHMRKAIPDWVQYQDAWHLIVDYLNPAS